jgi:hypothetical protein
VSAVNFVNEGDVVWTNYRHTNGSQWIRVVVLALFPDRVIVRPLFPGDVFGIAEKVFSVRREDIQFEEPGFDQLDSTYDGEGDFEFA